MTAQNPTRYCLVTAYDFSESAALALERAIRAACQHPRADLHVIGVIDDRGGLGRLRPGQRIDHAAARELQDEIRAVVAAQIPEEVSSHLHWYVHVRLGNPAEQILNLAAEANADVIVIGTHGRRGLSHWWFGSVAETVVRHAGCPVLVVRSKTYYARDNSAWAPEPPCPDCVRSRDESEGVHWWCERHSKPYVAPHRHTVRGVGAESDAAGSILW